MGMVSKVMGFRLMHLHGRALSLLVPRAVARLAAAGPSEAGRLPVAEMRTRQPWNAA
jgi:hypothetical protein